MPRRASSLLGRCALLGALGAAAPALAEKADRNMPVQLEADRVSVDDAKQVAVFEGNVRLRQGTLMIRAERIVVRQDADGFQHGTAYGAPASFRQKREGRDEFVEAYGDRIEYDGRGDRVEFFERARIRRGSDEVSGSYISYSAATEFFQVAGAAPGAAAPGAAPRVHAVIQPRAKDPAAPNRP